MICSFRKLCGGNVARSATMRYASTSVLSFKDVDFEYARGRPLIENSSFSILEGSKVTIMGQNGSGKSTMLKLIKGELFPETGSVNVTKGMRIAASNQVMRREDGLLTIKDFFVKHAPHLKQGIEGDIHRILNVVNLEAPLDRSVNTFSGGQQARLLLAAALIQDPDILLLDEPTNNLDRNGINHLTDFILGFEKTCVVISHDEQFLNSFTDSVLYLDSWSHKIESYDGNYNDVKRDIARRIEKENRENARLAKEAQAKKDQANKFKDKGGGMRKVAKKLKEEAASMTSKQVDVRKEDKPLKSFTIPCQFGMGGDVLDLSAVSLPNAGGRGTNSMAVIPLEFPVSMKRGMRLHLMGPNGIGKTTLLQNIVEGKLDGCAIQPGVRVGYYRQDFSTLNFEHTVVESLQEACASGMTESEIRKTASGFMLSGPIMNQKIATLSEGQKGLCAFARLVLQEPGLLILDEPTNHINFRHIPAIANALNEYKGAMIIVSHDRSFLKKVNTDSTLDLGEEMERFAEWSLALDAKKKAQDEEAVRVAAAAAATKQQEVAAPPSDKQLSDAMSAFLTLRKSGLRSRPTRMVARMSSTSTATTKAPAESSAQ